VESNSDWRVDRSLPRSTALAIFLILLLLGVAGSLPTSAFAVEQRQVVESFGTSGTSATSFERPTALSFDQGNKRLYALDDETAKIHGFDASTVGTHTPLGGSFPLTAPGAGFFDDIGVNSATHNLYFASVGESKLFGFDSTGALLSGFPVEGQNFPCGVATDSAGDIWVAEGNEGKLQKYNPAGVLLDTVSTGTGTEPCDLAIDSNDNIYVSFFIGPTKKFTAASNYTNSTQVDGETTNAIAVDQSTDELYVAHYNYISVYEANGTFLYEFGKSVATEEGEFSGVAIDQASEQVYASSNREHKVLVFGPPLLVPKLATEGADGIAGTAATVHGTVNPKGSALSNCHFEVVPVTQFNASGYNSVTPAEEFPCVPAAGSIPVDSSSHAVSANVTGLTTATVYHYRLVATNAVGEGKGPDRAFTSGSDLPLIEGESIEAVGATEATVAAKINPMGGETTYEVEYGTTGAYGQSSSQAILGNSFPSDRSFHTVSVHIGGLQPGSAYHFRFVASNKAGTVPGPDVTFVTYTIPQRFGLCSNDQFRTGFGSHLPDCRAYEQASPAEKHGSNAQGTFNKVEASANGKRVTFFANGGLETTGGSDSLAPFMASRGPSGWSTNGLTPPTSPANSGHVVGWDEELEHTLTLTAGAEGQQLFLRDSPSSFFQPGPALPSSFSFPTSTIFAADTSHLVLQDRSRLLPSAAPTKFNLYDLDHGVLSLAGRVPAGAAVSCDDNAGPACVVAPEGSNIEVRYLANFTVAVPNTISRDGSRVFFYVPSEEFSQAGRIYMREDGTKTTWISASQRTTPDPNGEKPATLAAITPDGSKVLFLSCQKLTDDSTAVSDGKNACEGSFGDQGTRGQDIYSYDVETGDLTDLTVDSNPGDSLGATVEGLVGISDDGSYVYFVADGVLAPGASPDSNLYVYHDGVTKLIAKNPGVLLRERETRVTPDGKTLLLTSRVPLTGYANLGCTEGPAACREVYRYSAPEEELLCVSCNPTGVLPNSNAQLAGERSFIIRNFYGQTFSRNLSSDGDRVFFESREALVQADTNGVTDVYEWEAKGTGSCESDSQNGGCVYLISSGTSPETSQFLDASANGDHVFFFTEQPLVPTDQDQLLDVYDAGVGAGLASQRALAPPTCATTACQANPLPPPDPSTASAVYSGAGNAPPAGKSRKCPKGMRKVRRDGKAQCRRRSHKRHQKRAHDAGTDRANANRGGSK
jgi:hypothetical protein